MSEFEKFKMFDLNSNLKVFFQEIFKINVKISEFFLANVGHFKLINLYFFFLEN